jgi:hypothetical protein
MKTTVELSDSLMQQARRLARREGIPLRALIERGLHSVIESSKRTKPFRLRRASFRGDGLQGEFRDGGWEAVREQIYRGHGG